MANSIPMWWMRGNNAVPPQNQPPQKPQEQPLSAMPKLSQELGDLTERIKNMDTETLLLLALLWLLYQEHADRKLLLALAYIAL